MKLSIEKNGEKSLCQQLVDQIDLKIQAGEIALGEKLPTERMIEKETGISRGTIKSAFKKLAETGRIKTIQGSGSYVLSDNTGNAYDMAGDKIRALFEYMDNLDISLPELESLFREELNKRYRQKKKVSVAWIDCCRECLLVVGNQMEPFRQMKLTTFLLENLPDQKEQIQNNYDVVVTTAKHYDAVSSIFNNQIGEIEKVTLDLKMSSIISLAKIPPHKRIALWSASDTFLGIMHEILDNFDNIDNVVDFVGEENIESTKKQIMAADYLIVSPEYAQLQMNGMTAAIREYEMSRGNIVLFEYQLNQGSAIHFQDRVLKCYKEKNHNA